MKKPLRGLLAFPAAGIALLLSGCTSDGIGYTSVGVWYGYPYYGSGWDYYPYPCCWDDDDHHHHPDRPKPVTPIQPANPRPLPGRPITTPGAPSRPKPPSNIGRPRPRPSIQPMRAPRAMPRRGGGRRR
ncbi:hypothetical protein MIN45_P1484 [Methylomarinovum tepidoasis]|uniref:Lipoprotein n=1 Tax=Methylomarinovum tepidoasis TaxID=2840183 RepID=A0AAU9CYK8_9GAMM|nr:hypothetical protein [Methylomarinovum sp. IN45]BCX89114.1 hypothetical protein MIN45_P1484 [Methylomarinovum sp. IN45]